MEKRVLSIPKTKSFRCTQFYHLVVVQGKCQGQVFSENVSSPYLCFGFNKGEDAGLVLVVQQAL